MNENKYKLKLSKINILELKLKLDIRMSTSFICYRLFWENLINFSFCKNFQNCSSNVFCNWDRQCERNRERNVVCISRYRTKILES